MTDVPWHDERRLADTPLGLPPLARADGSPARVLVVDDEQALAAAVGGSLRADGWEVRVEHRGRDALIAVREFQPDVVVLDIMMPDIDGLETLDRIRAIRPEIRVLFLTALDGHDDRIAGLHAGGDDYLTKPFAIAELQARVRVLAAHGRRDRPARRLGAAGRRHRAGQSGVDGRARRARSLELTPTEFELLLLLANNAGRVLRRSQILEDGVGVRLRRRVERRRGVRVEPAPQAHREHGAEPGDGAAGRLRAARGG